MSKESGLVRLGVSVAVILLGSTGSAPVSKGRIVIDRESGSQIQDTLPDFIVAESLYAQLGISNSDPDKDSVLKKIFSGLLSDQIQALNEQFDRQTVTHMKMKIWGVPSVNGYVFDISLGDKKFIYSGKWVRLPDDAEIDEGDDGIIYQISDILFVPAWKSK